MATQDARPSVTDRAVPPAGSPGAPWRRAKEMARRLAKLLLSLAYFGVRQALRTPGLVFPRRRRPDLVVLTYHQVRESQVAAFERQLDAMAAAGRLVFPDAVPPRSAKGRFIAVTFDDGLEEAFKVAVPILTRKRVCSAWFLITGYLGRTAGWIRENTHRNFGARLAPVAEAQHLDPSLFKIGTHTVTHRRLSGLSPEESVREIGQARRDLEEALGVSVDLLAFPYGAYGQQTLSHCQEAGYRCVFGNLPVWGDASCHGYVRGRIPAEPSDWRLEFWLKLRGGYNWLALNNLLRRRRTVGREPGDRSAMPV
jgi:peptidoglycan/xylan/chitin deacetylase (PgdA/CDA1 family)